MKNAEENHQHTNPFACFKFTNQSYDSHFQHFPLVEIRLFKALVTIAKTKPIKFNSIFHCEFSMQREGGNYTNYIHRFN